MLVESLVLGEMSTGVHEDVYHVFEDVGWSRWLCDGFATVGTGLFLAGGKPCAETAVAVCVAAGDNVGFVHEALADLACVELSQAVEACSECVQGLRDTR
jgi:hypothetical protein